MSNSGEFAMQLDDGILYKMPQSDHLKKTPTTNKPGTAKVGAPLKVQKSKVFYICKRTLLLKFHLLFSAKKHPKGYA